MVIFKEKQYGLFDAVGDAGKQVVDTTRDVTGSAVSGAGKVMSSGIGQAAGFGLGAMNIGTGASIGAGIGSVLGPIGTGLGAIAGGIAAPILGAKAAKVAGNVTQDIGDAIHTFSENKSGSVLKEKLYFWGTAIMTGTSALGMAQAHSQGKDQEEQAEQMQRLQKQQNKQLKRIADSADPNAGQAAGQVLQQGQSMFSMEDARGSLEDGAKSLGNTAGGVAGAVGGGALGTAAGAGLAAGGMAIANKVAGKKIMGAGKAGLIGAGIGAISGSILGGQQGSSLFSLKEKSYAALMDLGKDAIKLAGKNKGVVAGGLTMGASMGLAGYGVHKAQQSSDGDSKSALKKVALGTGATLAGLSALKFGANAGMLGKFGQNYNRAIVKGAGNVKNGVLFGAGLGAMSLVPQTIQQSSMENQTGDGEKKSSGLKTAAKVGLGALATGAALYGGAKFGAKQGWIKGDLGKKINDFSIDKKLGNVRQSISDAKENLTKKVLSPEKYETYKNNIANNKALDKAQADASKAALDATGSGNGVSGLVKKIKENPLEGVIETGTNFIGAGNGKTYQLAEQMAGSDMSQTTQDVGNWLMKHNKTRMLALAAPVGAATFGAWGKGQEWTDKALKKVDKSYNPEEQGG